MVPSAVVEQSRRERNVFSGYPFAMKRALLQARFRYAECATLFEEAVPAI
jgi:hypothetical protein